MDQDTVVTLTLALCCIIALGTAATALDSAVSTEPGDVIEIDYESVPISADDAEQLRERYEESAEDGDDEPAASSDDSADSESDRSDSASDSSDASSDASSSADSSASDAPDTQPDQSWLDRLLALLETLLDVLLRVLAILLLIGAALVAYRYRHRLPLPWTDSNDPSDETGAEFEPAPPSNEVLRAWYAMITSLDLGARREKTPRQYTAEAIDRGADPDAVTTLTDAFEEVRYGDRPTTDERIARARNGLKQVQATAESASSSGEARESGSDSNDGMESNSTASGRGASESNRGGET